MKYNPAWNAIGDVDAPLSLALIDEVNAVLFAPDPPASVLADVEVCVVLGSRNCAYKAERAAELFGARPNVIFVACGANLASNGVPEAEVIQAVLMRHGVADDRVLIDEHSTNTPGNLIHAERLIAERLGDPSTVPVAIVSSGFHRRHVYASLPLSLQHAAYVSATGPLAGPDSWHTNAMGRGIILHELQRPSLVSPQDV